MPTFSLILATCGRTEELHRFFGSLDSDDHNMLECILVDQNQDDRLQSVISLWDNRLRIERLRCAKGLSRARNAGLPRATGDFIAFPDDDCWYSIGLLRRVADFFANNHDFDMLSTGVRDSSGTLSGNRWISKTCDLTTANLFRTSVGLALFVRRSRLAKGVVFDETLGLGSGTPFGSGEDTDFVFRLIEAGLRGRFDRNLTVHHPRRDMLSGQTSEARAYDYGCGMGRVIRKHAKLPLLPAFVAFDTMRTCMSLLRGRFGPARLCAAHGRGVVAGYLAAE